MIFQNTTSSTPNQWTRAFVLPVIGTGAITTGENTVTGIGTTFTTSFTIGDEIAILNEKRRVTSILSNTSLVVDSPFNSTLTGQPIGILPSRYRTAGSNKIILFTSALSNSADIVLGESTAGSSADISSTVGSMRVYAGQTISPIVSVNLFNIFVQSPSAGQIFYVIINQ